MARQIFPFPRLLPLSSFFPRFIEKNSHAFSWYVLSPLGFSASKFIGRDSLGNGVLSLNRRSPLGKKGDMICLPIDNVIFKWVLRRGRWEEHESNFLADHVNRSSAENIVFIDIGGQAGLVSRQIFLRLNRPLTNAWIVEPFGPHITAIENNCEAWIANGILRVFPYALDSTDAQRELHIQNNNSGNASLINLFSGKSQSKSYFVNTKSVPEFEKSMYFAESSIYLKCDIQGLDSKVLSLFSSEFWSQVKCCVIEIWAIDAIEISDVEKLMMHWNQFVFLSWDSLGDNKCTLDEVRSFWTSRSGATRNLYISV